MFRGARANRRNEPARLAIERPVKTARFSTVVAKAGTPRTHLTWGNPTRDPELRRAAKENRLLTVHQEARGNKKDFGVVGLNADPGAQFFIFPRSLRRFVKERIVAIEYPGETGAEPRPISKRTARPKRSTKPPVSSRPRPIAPVVPFTPERREPAPAPEPATMREIRQEIGHVRRALERRQYAAARRWLDDLNARLPR